MHKETHKHLEQKDFDFQASDSFSDDSAKQHDSKHCSSSFDIPSM